MRMLCSFQLCVNIVNERLRRHVSEMLFQQEQAECVLEGIPMETPCSPCNQPAVLDFFLQVLGATGLAQFGVISYQNTGVPRVAAQISKVFIIF